MVSLNQQKNAPLNGTRFKAIREWLLVENLDEGFLLTIAKASKAARLVDADLGHELLGGNLAEAGECSDELLHAHLAQSRVVDFLESLLSGKLASLDVLFILGTLCASCCGLLQGLGPLLIGHLRQCHSNHCLVSFYRSKRAKALE